MMDLISEWWIGGLEIWALAPVELRAFALAVFAIWVLMEWLKRAFLTGLPLRDRVTTLWAVSLPLGLALAVGGLLLTGNAVEPVYWVVIGLTAGTTAMGVHSLMTRVVFPAIRFLGRRVLLAARGS